MVLHAILNTIILATSPDLCADVYVDDDGNPYTDAIGQTLSRFCEWTGPSAPVLDLDVCCTFSGDSAKCSVPDEHGRCSTESKAAYCEYGDVMPEGGVTCYQPFPSACDFGFCGDVLPPNSGPVGDVICCWGDGSCTEVESGQDLADCIYNGGIDGYCVEGAQNLDGTVDCFE